MERVVEHLRSGILTTRYAPGQRLIEADLTRDLGVSRGPLREAFRRLTAEGLIETVPNRGALVRRLTLTETIELFQIRTELEALAARLSASNVSEPDIRAAFEGAIAPIWSEAPRLSAMAYLEENKQFHDAIVGASGNCQLVTLHSQLQLPLIMFQVSGGLTAEILCHSVAEHREIAQAILDGDAPAAEAALRGHLERAADLTAHMPPSTFRAET
ncbi:GntR family transcriptional regulator [Microbaculum marinum]|uniref:GntR family transcriptional regulator n=1 Tax=Microbaculum marinum TaxID=1764581 RepID=A0AAW9RXD4_9HYPH